jgi:ligand-binding sensor domain-containing protein/serine phosphatase RsbU (regulator of sigma subunit)
MTVSKCIVFLVFLLSLLSQPADSQEYNFRTLNSSDGLAEPYVYSVIQDAHGYLWIGTGEGLSKYNGFLIESFNVSDSLAENFITASVCDDNLIWFGHRNGEISFFDGKKFRPVRYGEKKLTSVSYMAKSPEGHIYLATMNDGIFMIDRDRIIPVAGLPLENAGINCFECIGNNEFLVGTGTGLLFCKTGDIPEKAEITPVSDFKGMSVSAIKRIKRGTGFYVATADNGIFSLTVKGNEVNTEKIFTSLKSDLGSIQSLCEDSHGDLWLGSFGQGLIKLFRNPDGEENMTAYNTSSGFITDNVKVIYEDNEGNIWSGNYGEGITQITRRLFSLSTYDKTAYGNNIFSIFPDGKSLWLGTGKGLLNTDRNTGKVIKFYGKASGLPEDTVTAVLKAGNERIWIGTDKNGLFWLDTGTGKIVSYPVGEGRLENSITALAAQDQLVWAGTKKGLFSIDPVLKEISWYSVSKGGLPHNWVNCLFTDREGMLWITTHSSIISYIKRRKLTRMTLSSVPGTMTLGPVSEDSFSRIWVGSKGNGVYIIDSDSALSLTTREGLYSDYCYSIAGTGKDVWVGHKNALSRIGTSDFMVNPVQYSDDLPVEYRLNPNAVVTDESNMMWFGSDIGLICYDPSGETSFTVPPAVNITSVWINGQEEELDKNRIQLSPGSYKIRFDFIGISLRDPSLVSYQYKLENYDQWSDVTKNTSVTYNRLTDGNYLFMLKAYGGDGSVSDNPLIISVIIERPLWKKWWFYPLCVVIIALVVWTYVRWRLNWLLGEKRILEEKVLERTREIQAQKEEIEHQRDLIERKNNSITSSINYASNIQHAVLPSDGLISKLLPDCFILSKPRDIVSGDFYWITEREGKIVIAVADCTGHGVPGAFMSLLGISLLNEIVDRHGIINSDKIVMQLRELVVHLLQQDRSDITTRDGMDITLCIVDPLNKTFQYTGAMNDLVFVTGGQISVLKADRMSVSASEKYEEFTMNEQKYNEGDIIYLFTDGYKDQFGGEFDRKFLKTAFYTTLFEVSNLPVEKQKEFLENKLSDWMKNNEQTDDITVMGIRL